MSDKCPKCGADAVSGDWEFSCESFRDHDIFRQSPDCRIRQLEAQLRQSMPPDEIARRLNCMGQLISAGDHGMCVVVRAKELAEALGLAFSDGRFAAWGNNPEQEPSK